MSDASANDEPLPGEGCRPETASAAARGPREASTDGLSDDKTPVPPGALRIRCAHCHGAILLADGDSPDEISCSSCGSKLSLMGELGAGGGGPDSADRPAPAIGHFRLLQRLGAGGFGVVWKARDEHLDRIVAIKIPHKGQLQLTETEKFLREARAAAQLRHPSIVSVHEVGVEGGCAYIVSDFIEGMPLDQWLADNRPTCREAAAFCLKTAEALHHAHQRGVIHRDLKPSNIMIDPAGEPHIMDFGLAKRSAGEITMTMEGQVLGTPAYMSPEQAQGMAHAADPRTDLYSLGVILFELVTGERPFRGSLEMLLRQVIEDEPPSPRKLNGHVPRDLETICLKCLQKEPARRYGSAKAAAEELSRFLAGMPIEARPVGTFERVRRWCRRNPLIAGSVAAAVACLLFGLVAASVGYVRTSRALEDARQAQSRAEASLLQARQAVDDLFTRVSEDTLLNQPGMQRLRGDLLGRARDYYERLLAQNSGSQTIGDDLSLAHFRVGLITEEIESPGKALPSYDHAKEMQMRLLEADPHSVARLEALGDTYNAIGRALQKQNQLDLALAAHAAAIEIRNRLVLLAPHSMEFKRTLANSWMNTGLAEKGRSTARAQQCMEKAQAIRQEIIAVQDGDAKVRRDLAMGYYNLGTLGLETGEASLAESSLEKGRSLFEELLKNDRDDITLPYQVAVCCRLQADAKCSRKDQPEAIRLYSKALDVLEPLAAKNPSVPEYQVALAEILINTAQAEVELGQVDSALARFARAQAILTPLVAQHAEIARYRRDFLVTLCALGKLHRDPSERAGTLHALAAFRQRLEQMASTSPDDEEVRQHVELARAAVMDLSAAGSPPP